MTPPVASRSDQRPARADGASSRIICDVSKVYDQAYYDRWYRDPRTRVRSEDSLRRKVRMAASIAEFFLGRPLETVLDVGCGEGAWLAPLKALRPGLEYLGVDGSAYAVDRFGGSRNLRHASFGDVGKVAPRGRFDLVVCADMLHYVDDAELERGFPQVVKRLGGVAYLEVLTTEDDVDGDLAGWNPRSAAFYRDFFRRHALAPIGLMCWIGEAMSDRATSLEVLDA